MREGGFCEGAKRAFEATVSTGKATCTWGPLLHNPQVTERLAQGGVRAVTRIEDVSPGGCLILPAHGVPKGFAEDAAVRGLKVIDATCPQVLRVRRKLLEVSQRANLTLIAGWKGHTEAKNLLTWAEGRAIVVSDASELDALDLPEQVALIAQTTYPVDAFSSMAEALRRIRPGAEVFDTGCATTRAAQRAASEAAKSADAVIVIGGSESANTARLSELCGRNCGKVIRIESARELRSEDMCAARHIALAAGASTPPWVVDETVRRLKEEFGFDES